MMLLPGETGVCSEQMFAWAPPQPVPGTLYLTNLRLVFEPSMWYPTGDLLSQAFGVAPPSPPPMLNLDVRAITNVAMTSAPNGGILLRVEANGGAFVYPFQTPRAQDWVASIQGARGRAGVPAPIPPPPTTSMRPPGPPVPSAPSAPALSSVSGAPRPPVAAGTVWCARCGKANTSGAARCTSCGAALG